MKSQLHLVWIIITLSFHHNMVPDQHRVGSFQIALLRNLLQGLERVRCVAITNCNHKIRWTWCKTVPEWAPAQSSSPCHHHPQLPLVLWIFKQKFGIKEQFFTTNGRPELCVVSGCTARLLGADLAAALRDRKSWRAPNRGMTPTPAPLIFQNGFRFRQRSRQTPTGFKADLTNQVVSRQRWLHDKKCDKPTGFKADLTVRIFTHSLSVNENSDLQR